MLVGGQSDSQTSAPPFIYFQGGKTATASLVSGGFTDGSVTVVQQV